MKPSKEVKAIQKSMREATKTKDPQKAREVVCSINRLERRSKRWHSVLLFILAGAAGAAMARKFAPETLVSTGEEFRQTFEAPPANSAANKIVAANKHVAMIIAAVLSGAMTTKQGTDDVSDRIKDLPIHVQNDFVGKFVEAVASKKKARRWIAF